MPASVLAVLVVLAICAPASWAAENRNDACLSCHTPNELLPAGIPNREELSDRLKWPACPGMSRIRRANALTENVLAELDVLTYRNGSRNSPEDKALREAEARFRRLREAPIVAQSVFVDGTGELRRQVDARVLKPLETKAKKRRLAISLVALIGMVVVASVLIWLVLARISRKKREASEPPPPDVRTLGK